MTDVTDAPLAIDAAVGRSLWADAWIRLKANKAALFSAIYLVLMTIACVIGPSLTGHDFTTIYPDYVRVPPSLSPYPQGDQIEGALGDALRRARVDLVSWSDEGDRIVMEVSSTRPIDERITRYLERSSTFEDPRVEGKGADGLTLTMSAAIQRLRFLFGTDNSGRDLLTRTLAAGRVSLAIGVLAGFVAVVIGVIYGAASGYLGGKTDEIMMRIVDVLYSLP
ncbi:MAG: ABC transporter permease, partial [Rhizobiales bacterium]|nr:ABC transporter permease [Hyphomicrobiales bacterium]